jgi:hypothetical protein
MVMSLNELAAGLQILAKYYDLDNPCEGGADHDIVYGPTVEISEEDIEKDEIIDRRISEEDRKKLTELNWFVAAEHDYCWCKCV